MPKGWAEAEARQGIRGRTTPCRNSTRNALPYRERRRQPRREPVREPGRRGGRGGGGRGGGLIPLAVIPLAAIPLTAVCLAASRLVAVAGVGAASSETADNQRYIGPAGVCELLFGMGSWRRHDLVVLF